MYHFVVWGDIMYHKIIKEICDELNIKCTFLSKDWVIMLEKDNIKKYITGYKFDINTQSTSNIVDDKYALYEVLKINNIPVINHNIIYSKNNNNEYAKGCNDYNNVLNYFKEHNNHIVIKANNGTCGNEVYNITNMEDIISCLDNLFKFNHSLSICPFYDIENEYRTIILDGEVLLTYKKIKPLIIGNGINTIRELLLEFNHNYFKDKLTDDKYNKVLKKNEIYEYGWQFNLSRGAKIDSVDDVVNKKIINLSKKVASIVNLKFGSIDIIKTNDNKYYAMEANSGVMMKNYINNEINGYNIAKDIYKKAIIKMFNGDNNEII